MAFTPETLGVIVQPIGGEGMRFISYRTDDAQASVTATSYFAGASSYGIRVNDLIFVSPLTTAFDPYILVVETVDSAGDGTAVISDEEMLKSIYDPQGIEGDAFDRANHTGTQAISTVEGLSDALEQISLPDPAVANTVPVRNAGNTAYEAKPVGATGLAVLEAETPDDVRELLKTAVFVATRTELKALDTAKDTAAYLTEAGREGVFIWRTGNYSSAVTSDTQEGIYIKADDVAASSGAWVREFDGAVHVDWFRGSGAAEHHAIAKAADAAKRIYDAGGTSRSVVELRFPNEKIIVNRSIALTNHGGVALVRPILEAEDGGWLDPETNYLLNCTGTAHSNAQLQIIKPVLECNHECRGITISNAATFLIDYPTIYRFKGVGLEIGVNTWLGEVTGGGSLHEWESGETGGDLAANREATGVHLNGCADVSVNVLIGWTHICVKNEATGMVRLSGHWYCQWAGGMSDDPAYNGYSLINDTTARILIDNAYIDSGIILYKRGIVDIGDNVLFYRNGSAVGTDFDAYVHAEAQSANQYASLNIHAPQLSNRAIPFLKKIETGGNSWKNLGGGLTLANRQPYPHLDTITDSVLADIDTVRSFEAVSRSLALIGFRDQATTTPPQVGSSGNNLVFRKDDAVRWSVFGAYHSLVPWTDNASALGGPSARPTTIYAVSGTINTSDAREKEMCDEVDIDTVLDAVASVPLRQFKWKDAIAKKGEGARIHFGYFAQDVADAFESRGIDPYRLGLVCADPIFSLDEDGTETPVLDEEGNQYVRLGLRMDQFMLLRQEAANR